MIFGSHQDSLCSCYVVVSRCWIQNLVLQCQDGSWAWGGIVNAVCSHLCICLFMRLTLYSFWQFSPLNDFNSSMLFRSTYLILQGDGGFTSTPDSKHSKDFAEHITLHVFYQSTPRCLCSPLKAVGNINSKYQYGTGQTYVPWFE